MRPFLLMGSRVTYFRFYAPALDQSGSASVAGATERVAAALRPAVGVPAIATPLAAGTDSVDVVGPVPGLTADSRAGESPAASAVLRSCLLGSESDEARSPREQRVTRLPDVRPERPAARCHPKSAQAAAAADAGPDATYSEPSSKRHSPPVWSSLTLAAHQVGAAGEPDASTS